MSRSADAATVLIEAALVVDGVAVAARPGCILVREGKILAAGAPEDVDRHAADVVVGRPDEVVMPALVNCHTHLDLTHIGPRPYGGDFVGWIDMVRRGRHQDPAAIAASVRQGLALAHAGGVAAVGDIAGAGHLEPVETLRAEDALGVGYLEVFGTGPRAAETIERLGNLARFTEGGPTRLGVQPHAPYSCERGVYAAAAALAARGLPCATHLAESAAERELVARGTGPLAEFLAGLGAAVPEWDADHPIDAVLDVWPGRFLAVHVNDVEPRHLMAFAERSISVAYCPRATDYFGHGPHDYRAMLEAGINVALGTDSIVGLDTPDRLSVLDEMRYFLSRDGTDARTLLAMATVAGAGALGLPAAAFTLEPGPTAGLIALPVDAVDSGDLLSLALAGGAAPRWCAGPFHVSRDLASRGS